MKTKYATPLVLVAGSLSMSACSVMSASTSNDMSAGSSNVVSSDVITAKTNVDNSMSLAAGKSIEVNAQDPWVVESVSTTGVSGTTEDQGLALTVWKSAPVDPGQMTTVRVTMLNAQTGETQTIQRNVVGGPAQRTYTATITPPKGKYGVGVIPIVEFSKSVPVADRPELTSHLSVTSSPTALTGGWRWISDTQAAYRPSTQFWPARQTVTVKADIANVKIGGSKAGTNDSWGQRNETATYKVQRAMVLNLNANTHEGVATVDGKVVRKFGISLGKPGYTTRSGIKTIMERYSVTRMTNVGVTNDSVYDIQVPLAMRLTVSGEFLHAAPWNGNIGYANTSHGCSNISYDDASYFFNKTIEGDPVITKNTGRPIEAYNGPGALWNIPFAKWVKFTSPKPTA